MSAGRDISQHCTFRALGLLQMMLWLSHHVVVVTRSVVVYHVDEAGGVVVCSVAVEPVHVICGSLWNSLENRFDLETAKIRFIFLFLCANRKEPSTHLEVFTEDFLFVFVCIIDFRFVQFKYHISIRIH
jgi:hypothetical protein